MPNTAPTSSNNNTPNDRATQEQSTIITEDQTRVESESIIRDIRELFPAGQEGTLVETNGIRFFIASSDRPTSIQFRNTTSENGQNSVFDEHYMIINNNIFRTEEDLLVDEDQDPLSLAELSELRERLIQAQRNNNTTTQEQITSQVQEQLLAVLAQAQEQQAILVQVQERLTILAQVEERLTILAQSVEDREQLVLAQSEQDQEQPTLAQLQEELARLAQLIQNQEQRSVPGTSIRVTEVYSGARDTTNER